MDKRFPIFPSHRQAEPFRFDASSTPPERWEQPVRSPFFGKSSSSPVQNPLVEGNRVEPFSFLSSFERFRTSRSEGLSIPTPESTSRSTSNRFLEASPPFSGRRAQSAEIRNHLVRPDYSFHEDPLLRLSAYGYSDLASYNEGGVETPISTVMDPHPIPNSKDMIDATVESEARQGISNVSSKPDSLALEDKTSPADTEAVIPPVDSAVQLVEDSTRPAMTEVMTPTVDSAAVPLFAGEEEVSVDGRIKASAEVVRRFEPTKDSGLLATQMLTEEFEADFEEERVCPLPATPMQETEDVNEEVPKTILVSSSIILVASDDCPLPTTQLPETEDVNEEVPKVVLSTSPIILVASEEEVAFQSLNKTVSPEIRVESPEIGAFDHPVSSSVEELSRSIFHSPQSVPESLSEVQGCFPSDSSSEMEMEDNASPLPGVIESELMLEDYATEDVSPTTEMLEQDHIIQITSPHHVKQLDSQPEQNDVGRDIILDNPPSPSRCSTEEASTSNDQDPTSPLSYPPIDGPPSRFVQETPFSSDPGHLAETEETLLFIETEHEVASPVEPDEEPLQPPEDCAQSRPLSPESPPEGDAICVTATSLELEIYPTVRMEDFHEDSPLSIQEKPDPARPGAWNISKRAAPSAREVSFSVEEFLEDKEITTAYQSDLDSISSGSKRRFSPHREVSWRNSKSPSPSPPHPTPVPSPARIPPPTYYPTETQYEYDSLPNSPVRDWDLSPVREPSATKPPNLWCNTAQKEIPVSTADHKRSTSERNATVSAALRLLVKSNPPLPASSLFTQKVRSLPRIPKSNKATSGSVFGPERWLQRSILRRKSSAPCTAGFLKDT